MSVDVDKCGTRIQLSGHIMSQRVTSDSNSADDIIPAGHSVTGIFLQILSLITYKSLYL